MAKLIIINGPAGVGKSTAAWKLHKMIQGSVLIEIDYLRSIIRHSFEEFSDNVALANDMALAMTDTALAKGRDVIIDRMLWKTVFGDESSPMIFRLRVLGMERGVERHEFFLSASKKTVILRARERGFPANKRLSPDAVKDFWERMQGYWSEDCVCTAIDAEQSPSEILTDIIDHIGLDLEVQTQ